MKRGLFLIILIMSCLVGFSQSMKIDFNRNSGNEIIKSDFQTLRAVFSYSSLESAEVTTERGVFSEITIPGTYRSGEIGTPELPATHELLAVPFGAIPVVNVISYTAKDYNLSDYGISTILPHQPSVRKDQKPEDVEFVYNEAAYQTRGLAFEPTATIEVQGTMRGIRIGSLVINPVSYDAKANTIRVFNDIEVEVSFDGADIAETERMLINTYSPYFDIVYKQMFNYRQILDVYTDHPDLMAYPVHMIVIAPQNYVSTLEPWTNWKIQKGFDVNVYTTSQTGSTYSAIRSYVQNLYNTGVSQGKTPTFLILVGDTGQIPGTNGSSTSRVTDLYYGSVDNDYFPDMFYSRISAENTTQLTNIINKILQYEQYTMPDPSYLSKVTLIAGWDSNWTSYVGAPTVNYATTNYYNTAHGFTQVNSHVNQSQYNGCYNSLSTGVGFVNYTAHGDNTMWYQPQLTNSGVNQLSNTNKYFLAMGNCCLTGNFGYSSACFGEAMIRAENKGAYSYIGSCPETYWYEDYYFGVGATSTLGSTPNINNTKTGVYDAVWMDDTYNTVSSMTFLGNIAVCYAYTGSYSNSGNSGCSQLYYWQAYHVLGDGSIMPYRVNPTANTVTHATQFPSGATSFTVNAEAGSYVGISQNNTLLGAALVPAAGSVSVPVTPVTSGQVKIVVTKPQRQPYSQTISVGGSAPQQYTITTSVNPANAGTVTGANTYTQGQQCTLTATPNAGYQFVNWTKNGVQVSTNASYTFTVTEAAAYVANFQIMSYTVTASSIPDYGGTIEGAGTYNYGEECTLTATPNAGFNFFNWVTNLSIYSTDASITFVVTEDMSFIANFSFIEYEVLASVDPQEGGTIFKSNGNHYGDTVTLTVTPAENYVFQNWTEDGVIVSEEESFSITLTTHHYFIAHLTYISNVGENDEQTMSIYPNPANDKLFIESNGNISNVEIYNLTGAAVLKQECNSDKVEMNVKALQSGVYFIRITTGNNTETRRFIRE
ncbi:MAG: T9SS type A sorting domain-containing protein [Bacteroidales bacterium]|nr:T9SS type A sorting domain-containing protein [Bacteroidales bacterium]